MSPSTSPRRRRAGGPLAAPKHMLEASRRSEQGHALFQAQNEIVALMAKDAKLTETLECAVSGLEHHAAPALCSIMRVDPTGEGLRHVAGRNLPKPLVKTLERIGVKSGDIGGAAARKSVFVRDIARLDEASKLRTSALAAGFRAWWSEPILAQTGGVLGTINLFYPEPGLPSRLHRSIVALLRPVIALAIELDRRALALRAAAAEARTREAITESLSQGLVMFNDQDRLTICNSAFGKLLPPLAAIAVSGAAYEDFIRAEIGLHAIGAESESAEERLGARLRQHTLRHHNFEKQLADGRWILVSERRTADRGVVLLYTDITKFKEKEEDRRKLQDQFYRAQKLDAIGRLAGSIAHDFNNILASILGNATFLAEDLPPDSDMREFAAQILTAGERAKTLVQQILMFSRHQSSDHEILDPRAIVAETGQLLRAALPTSIALNVRMPPFDAAISGNSTQLVQVLMNLCVNARDAIRDRHGSIDLEAEILPLEAAKAATGGAAAGGAPADSETCLWFGELASDQQYLRIRVRDSGCGMERDVMEKMFEPFFTTKEAGRGTGLGLAAVHGIIAGHHGIMAVASKPGSGSCFDIFLPTRNAVPAEAESAKPQTAPLGNESILVVDDEDQVSAVIARSLGRLGYKVECFNNAVAAIERFDKTPDGWSLVITDQTMPKMTGYELAQALAKRAPHLPIILCSGSADSVSAESATAAGIRTILHKPVDLTNLARAVRNALDARPNRGAAATQSDAGNI